MCCPLCTDCILMCTDCKCTDGILTYPDCSEVLKKYIEVYRSLNTMLSSSVGKAVD